MYYGQNLNSLINKTIFMAILLRNNKQKLQILRVTNLIKCVFLLQNVKLSHTKKKHYEIEEYSKCNQYLIDLLNIIFF